MSALENPSPTALITGGAKRVGRAIAEDLAAHGWAVAIHCNASRDEGEALARTVRDAGGRAAVVVADLARPEEAARIVAEAGAALGPVRLLVNNASIYEHDAATELDLDLWNRQMTVNVTTPVFLVEAFAKALPADMEGMVVNLLDQRVLRPTPAHFSYQMSKSALATATVVLAQALAPRIRVNGIAPGPVLPHSRQSAAEFAAKVANLPLQRSPELAEFGRTVRFLWDAKSVTGQIIALDGGEHLAAPEALP
ncbi:MAG: SDR family oxidoreductase [Rhizobiales bacterium]|nr:SDR family oxidoreductase [Hyphomicrobiales bacterium]